MKCPRCQSEDIEVVEKSAAAERPGWRHHHGSCSKCKAILWWSAPAGGTDAVVKTGTHRCPFFETTPTLQ